MVTGNGGGPPGLMYAIVQRFVSGVVMLSSRYGCGPEVAMAAIFVLVCCPSALVTLFSVLLDQVYEVR